MQRLFILFSFLLAITSVNANNLKAVEGDMQTPPLKLDDLQGNTHDLTTYIGKVVLVQFWGTYCPPCRKEMPSMNRLLKKMGDTPFKILAINMGEPEDAVRAFADEVKAEFTILLDPEGTGSIPMEKMAKMFSALDKNADGTLQKSELTPQRRRRGGEEGGRRPGKDL